VAVGARGDRGGVRRRPRGGRPPGDGSPVEERQVGTAHLSFGDFTVAEYFWQITQFRAFRAYEIAVLIGADAALPDELVQGVWEQLMPNIEQWRAIGVFGPAVEVSPEASLQDKLLGLSGRQPRPTAGSDGPGV